MTPPLISVIIPVRDDMERLELALEALARQSYPSFEVIVVDNGSAQDVAAQIGSRPGVRVVQEPVPGSYAARNRGVTVAAGNVFAFTDSDCIPDAEWLGQGAEAMERHPNSIAAGRIEVFVRDERSPTSVELYEKLFAFPQKRYVEEFHFGATANLFVPRSVFEETGGFRAALQSGGDSEFCQRAARRGTPVLYWPAAVVRHPARYDWDELHRKIRRLAKGRLQREALKVSGPKRPPDVAEAVRRVVRLWTDRDLSFRQKLGVQVVFVRFHFALLRARWTS
ncbi:MAG TPA: glycosyltransferase family A protein [Thermoanaerobaculia bacterium]|nr:glycosyltransferase family A protein [Thermoanaerobaculia bacterium]